MTTIIRFLIKNTLIKWIILLILFSIAFIAINNLKRFAFPRVDLNQVTIETIVPGFSVFEIKSKITSKIEAKLESIGGIKKYISTSYPNRSSIFIEIDSNIDVDEVKDKIRNKIANIGDFPREMLNQPSISEIKIDNAPNILLGVISKKNDLFNLRNKTIELKKLILASGEVAQIYESIPKKQIHILLDKEKMFQYQITFEEIYNTITSGQIRLTAGTIKSANKVINIVTLLESQTPEEIENIILRAKGYNEQEGIVLKIKDIAKVQYDLEKQNSITKFNGTIGHKLSIVKKAQSDILDFSKKITPLIDSFAINNPDIEVVLLENNAVETKQRLSIALNNGISSFFLVLITLFIFLRKSIAFWAVFEIPVTIFLTLTLMWLTNITINNISLCGIILTLGIIVDNPAVIGELVSSYQEQGYSPEEASIKGVKKIFTPLLFSLLTNIGAFASMFFIPGILGQFAIQIPIVVSFMMLASFMESIFILPSHLAHTRYKNKQPYGDKLLQKLKIIYRWLLTKLLYRPIIYFLLILLLSGGIGYWSVKQLNFFLFSSEQSSKINISGFTDLNNNLRYTAAQASEIEKIIDQLPPDIVSAYRTIIGSTTENNFKILLVLTPFFERELVAEDVRQIIKQKVEDNPNIKIASLDFQIDNGGPPSGKPIEVNVFSPNLETRIEVINRIKSYMEANNYLSEISTDLETGREEYRIIPKKDLSFSGVTTKRIANTLRFAYEGVKVKEIYLNNENLEWIIKLDQKSRDINDPLDKIYILNPLNKLIEVKDLLNLQKTTSLSKIIHEQSKPKNTISASFDVEKVSASLVIKNLSKKFLPLEKEFPHLKINFSGEAKESQDTLKQFIIAISVSIFFIYLILVIQFKNLSQPFLVISSIPFGIIGIFFAFAIQGMNISFLTLIGILGFGGVVINSSIIMIDFMNSNKEKMNNYSSSKSHPPNIMGKSMLINIVTDGALARFRPILITSLTTVIGFIPIAYGIIGETDSIVSPMTMGMLWGMFFGTISALFIVPILFIINDRISIYFKLFFKRNI